MSFQYWPEKLGALEVSVGNGNRIYSSVVLDKLRALPDSLFSFSNVELDYFKDVYLNLFHSIEPVNGLLVKIGASMHWRSLIGKDENELKDLIWPQLQKYDIRSSYNSFAPRIRIEWTPGLYYYMNGRRKMNVGSSMPTFILDYERGLKGVMGGTDEHERWELDIQQKIKLNQIRTIGYRLGCGMFTKMDNVYFVNFLYSEKYSFILSAIRGKVLIIFCSRSLRTSVGSVKSLSSLLISQPVISIPGSLSLHPRASASLIEASQKASEPSGLCQQEGHTVYPWPRSSPSDGYFSSRS
jgi:hypothetical protein